MHLRSLLFKREPAWRSARQAGRPAAPGAVCSWLYETGSLTARLRSVAGPGFGVRLLGQGWGRPFSGETHALGVPARSRALLREVLLHDGGKPLVLARTVIPPRTLRGVYCGLARLGDRPLGELLFSYQGLARTQLEWVRIKPAQWRQAAALEFGVHEPVWGRRSHYAVGDISLLVCEFFLPAVLSLTES